MMKTLMLFGTIMATIVAFAGCGKSPTNTIAGGSDKASAAHNHESWWCSEHGVPEEICALCHPKLAAKFKAAGDWCQKHDCPDSQCFVCHPEYEAKYALQYESKYGTKPPARTAGDDDHAEEKKD